jgi:O-antigen/teichoic acid export membrane protein
MSLFHVDVIMVRTLVGGEATGYYKAALSLAEYIWVVPLVLQGLLLHSSSSLWSDGRHEDIEALAGRITRYTVLLTILLALGLGVMADRVVSLYYGAPFGAASTPLRVLLPGVIGFAVARPLQAISQGSGELRVLIAAVGGAAVLNVTLNVVFIPRFGIHGAATATSVSYGSMFVLFVWAARRLGFDPLVDIRPWRVSLTGGIAAVVIVGSEHLIDADPVAFAVVPAAGFAAFALAAIGTGAVDGAEIRGVFDQLPISSRLASYLSK